MPTVQFTSEEMAPLRECINGHPVSESKFGITHWYAVRCGTVLYTKLLHDSEITVSVCKSRNTVRRDVDKNAPVYMAWINPDDSVVGDQEVIDIIADTVGR